MAPNNPPKHGEAAPPPFWIIAFGLRNGQNAESIYANLKQAVQNPKHPLCDEIGILDIPLNLKFGSFDDLIRSVDILQKQDTSVESILRRVERHALDLDPNTQFKILWQRHSLTVAQYIRRFTWDDAKFPRSRAVRENIEMLVQGVNKLDEEVRAKVAVWQSIRSQNGSDHSGSSSSSGSRDSQLYAQRCLIDVLTPSVIQPDDFVETEHLTTLTVCIPRGTEKLWQESYEKLLPNELAVVPRSSRQFAVDPDIEGHTLWRVVLFKKHKDAFKERANAKKFFAREFAYNESLYKQVVETRSKLEAERNKHEVFLSRVCFAAFSDIFIAWTHLKAMRVFCESVLRFGVPPEFASVFLRPLPSTSVEKKLRSLLETTLVPNGNMFGNKFYQSSETAAEDPVPGDPDVYYPYVYLTLDPITQTANSIS